MRGYLCILFWYARLSEWGDGIVLECVLTCSSSINKDLRALCTSIWEFISGASSEPMFSVCYKLILQFLTEQRYQLFPEERPPPPTPEPEKPDHETVDSPHPPSMTPIKEETDQDLKPTGKNPVITINCNIPLCTITNNKYCIVSGAYRWGLLSSNYHGLTSFKQKYCKLCTASWFQWCQ